MRAMCIKIIILIMTFIILGFYLCFHCQCLSNCFILFTQILKTIIIFFFFSYMFSKPVGLCSAISCACLCSHSRPGHRQRQLRQQFATRIEIYLSNKWKGQSKSCAVDITYLHKGKKDTQEISKNCIHA